MRFLPLLLLSLVANLACTGGRAAAPAPAAGADAAAPPVDRQAYEVCARFSNPSSAPELLNAAFLAQVPASQVEAIFADFARRLGRCEKVERREGDATSAKYRLRFSGGYTVPLSLSVEREAPHLVAGLLLGNPVQEHGSLEAIVAEMEKLPGKVSFLVADLGPDGATPRIALAPEERLAIGSAFKLYVLAELVRAVEAGERSWDEVVHLSPEAISLPSGLLQDWPEDAPLTLQTLATLMISRSDNTATDQLIHALGRERIEAMLAATGHGAPQRNQPFLTTRELFLLKGQAGGRYLDADLQERRAYLQNVVPLLSLEDDAPTLAEPTRIDQVEWFASASELASLLSWLQRHSNEGDPLRGLLTVNAGIDGAREGRCWVGFKGGSEPGVLNLSFLLENDDGSWQAVVATWNDPDQNLDEKRLVGLVERALQLLAR